MLRVCGSQSFTAGVGLRLIPQIVKKNVTENFLPIVIATKHLVSSMGLYNLYIHVHVPLIMFLYIHVQYKYVHCTCIVMYITIYLYICVHVHTYCMYCMYWCIYVHVQDRHTCICKYT